VSGDGQPDDDPRQPGPPMDPTATGIAPTALMQMALISREMHQAYVAAGFSSFEACVIIGHWMAASGSAGTGTTE